MFLQVLISWVEDITLVTLKLVIEANVSYQYIRYIGVEALMVVLDKFTLLSEFILLLLQNHLIQLSYLLNRNVADTSSIAVPDSPIGIHMVTRHHHPWWRPPHPSGCQSPPSSLETTSSCCWPPPPPASGLRSNEYMSTMSFWPYILWIIKMINTAFIPL